MPQNQTEPVVKSCGVLVFRRQPQLSFLLMEHANRWDLPKGHVDPGESELETALRELQEETGLSAEQIDLDPEFRFRYFYQVQKKRHGKKLVLKELVVFLGTLPDAHSNPEIELTEHIGYRWFDWKPPHEIQLKSIDPLLETVAAFWNKKSALS